jgi:serine acetyltransferase
MPTNRIRSIMKPALAYLYRRLAVRANVRLGKGVHIGPGSILWAPQELHVGNCVYIGKYVTIEVDGAIGDGCLIANNVGLVGRTDHDIADNGTVISRARWVGQSPESLSRPLDIGPDVWIGYGATVLSGIKIGASSVIGSGAVVTRSIPANSIAVGNPARVVGMRFPSDDELHEHWHQLERDGVRGLPTGPKLRHMELDQ